jgi:hypothetical protein
VVGVRSHVAQQRFLWWVCGVMLLSRGSCGGCAESCCLVEVHVGVCSHVAQQRFLWWVCGVMLLSRGSCGGCAESCCSAEVPVVGVRSHVA